MLLRSISFSAFLLISQWGLGVNSNKCDYNCDREIEFDATIKGEIKSPNYDCGPYPESLHCYYRLKAPEGYRIKVTIKDIDIDPTGSCGYDKLWIAGLRKGSDEKLLTVVCGSDIPPPIISREDENEIRMTFETDFMVSGRGFRLEYESAPGLELCSGDDFRTCRNRNCYHKSKHCDGKDDCGDGTDEEACGLPVTFPDANLCGSTPIEPSLVRSPDRQVGGTKAVPHSWPWQVSLQRTNVEPNGHFCGGALISPQYVVTAAHCVAGIIDPKELRIVLGSHNKYKKSKYEMTRVAEVIVSYPDLQGERLSTIDMRHDITVIKLNAPVQYNDGVQPVCLPYLGWETSPGWRCFSTGWGETRGSGFEEQLKQTEQIVQSNETCTFNAQSQICVDHTYNSPCHGDSGGPLVCKLGSKWYLMGATSYAISSNFMGGLCGMPENKVIFSKVSDKYDWIHQLIRKFG